MGNCQTSSSVDEPTTTRSKFKGKPNIFIKTYTWSRDSHGLFDYESRNLTKKNLKTTHPGRIMRIGDDVRVARENEKKQNQDENELMKLLIKDGNVLVDNCREREVNNLRPDDELHNCDKDLWLVVKSLKTNPNSKGYKLAEGDLIKLGRIKYRVRELKGIASKNSKNEKNTKIEDDVVSVADSDKKSASSSPRGSQNNLGQTCRICLSETPEPGDPFFSPCHCTGTMKYIHVKCLQRWLKSKLHFKQNGNLTSIYWKNLECELCKTQYPTYFMVEDKRYDIVEFDRPDHPFVILDVLSKDKNLVRGIYVMKMENKNTIRLGRGHDSDIRITDISVSRCHAFIKLDKGEFYIDDNTSKFGTLVHLNKAFTVPTDVLDVSLQVGRTVIALTVKRGKKFFSSCLKPTADLQNSVQEERHSEAEEPEEAGSDEEQHSPSSPTVGNRSPALTEQNQSPVQSPALRQPANVLSQNNADNATRRTLNIIDANREVEEEPAGEEEEEKEEENRVLGLEHLNAAGNQFDEEDSRSVSPDSDPNLNPEPTVRETVLRSHAEVPRRQDRILSNYQSHHEVPVNQELVNNANENECDGNVD